MTFSQYPFLTTAVSTIASFNVTAVESHMGGHITTSRTIPIGWGPLKKDLKAFHSLGKHSRKSRLTNTQIWAGLMIITPGGKLINCFLPRFLESSSGEKIVLATKSNNPNKPVPMVLPDTVLDHVLLLTKHCTIGHHVGTTSYRHCQCRSHGPRPN